MVNTKFLTYAYKRSMDARYFLCGPIVNVLTKIKKKIDLHSCKNLFVHVLVMGFNIFRRVLGNARWTFKARWTLLL